MTFNKQINGFDFFSEYGKSNALFWGGTIRGEGKIEPNDDGMPITSYTIEPTGNTRAENALSEFLHELKAEMEKAEG